jgi:hypothetical protein
MARLNYFYKYFFDSDIDMKSFDNRIRLQKIFFILKLEGMEMNYTFTWYIHGPYSPQLAVDGYTTQEHLNQKTQLIYESSYDERQMIKKLKNAFQIINDVNKLELIASYYYLRLFHGNHAVEILHLKKPKFDISIIKDTVKKWETTVLI